MNIDPQTQITLSRMTQLMAHMERLGDYTPEEIFAEYRTLLPGMVEEFLPLVNRLIAAGLLTIQVPDEAVLETKGYASVDFTPEGAFDNGNIWIVAGEFAGGTPINQTSADVSFRTTRPDLN